MSETTDETPTPRGVADCFTPRTTVVYALAVFVLGTLASLAIEYGAAFGPTTTRVLDWLAVVAAVLFAATTAAVIVASATGRKRLRHRALVVFFSVATLQTVVTVGSLLVTAHVRNDEYLWGVADVGAAYIAIAAVFTGWYWLLDGIVPGGAFVFPGRGGEDLQQPTFIDYFFISFNTNATFGPTSETVVSRRVKLVMMAQTSLSLLVLLVLVARLVGISGN